MKYLRIKNKGVIQPEALHLVGASSKRNQDGKIGQFGSGNKYALAFLIRNGYSPIVMAGKTEIKLTTEDSTFRDQDFKIICINGEKTSITTEMGKDWKLWQAIREIYSNALDEGEASIDFVQDISPVKGETHFYLENTGGDLMQLMVNFNDYFAMNKKVLFTCDQGTIYEKSGTNANIYRRGIRCHEPNKASLYDYDFPNIDIDENRLVKYYWHVEEKMWDLLFRCTDKDVIMNVLHSASERANMESNVTEYCSIGAAGLSKEFIECLQENKIAPSGYAGLLNTDEQNNYLIIPTTIYNAVRSQIPEDNVGESFKVARDGEMYRELELNPLQAKTIKEALYFMKEVDFEVNFDVTVAIFDNKKVLGYADQTEQKIVLSEICLEMGVNECVNTIIEEFIHLKYNVRDNTRGFQTSVITEFISYMKKVKSFAI